MGKTVISENVSLDGVIEDPSGVEGFKHGGWVGKVTDARRPARGCSMRPWARRRSCSVGEPTSSWPPGGHLATAPWRTG
jgi:hypothetical protein